MTNKVDALFGAHSLLKERRSEPTQVEAESIVRLIMSQEYCLQEKIDGQRCTISLGDVRDDGPIYHLWNKNGDWHHRYSIPSTLHLLQDIASGLWIFDAEYKDYKFYIFDILATPAADLTSTTFYNRNAFLHTVLAGLGDDPKLIPLKAVKGPKEQMSELLDLRYGEEYSEGVVLHKDTTYDKKECYKFKFYHELVCEVMAVSPDGKANIDCGIVVDSGMIYDPVFIGRVSTAGWPEVFCGQLVKVRTRGLGKPLLEGGRMIEPVLLQVLSEAASHTTYRYFSEEVPVIGVPMEREIKFDLGSMLLGIDEKAAVAAIKG